MAFSEGITCTPLRFAIFCRYHCQVSDWLRPKFIARQKFETVKWPSSAAYFEFIHVHTFIAAFLGIWASCGALWTMAIVMNVSCYHS